MIGLPAGDWSGEDGALAFRHRPILRLDAREPFPPLAFGWTVFHGPGQSPSSKFAVAPRASCVIEYAIWYDWDIQHLYDLEHVWVHVDANGDVVAVEASCHGRRVDMTASSGRPECDGPRPVLYAEPGKHAHWAEAAAMLPAARRIEAMCDVAGAGLEGVHVGNRFAETDRYGATAFDHRLARLHLKRQAFEPSFDFCRSSDDQAPTLLPWSEMEGWIPNRVKGLIASLPEVVPHLRAIFLDCGDTLADEATEIKIPGTEVVTSADLIPTARWCVESLRHNGYPLVLVADGPRLTFENILKSHGLWHHFAAHVISEDVGELKPHPKMFRAALRAIDLEDKDSHLVAMVGNNLSRDIAGANALGLISIFMAWSTRRTHDPAVDIERPDYTITLPSDLLRLIERIEIALK